jgi:hypothetical protein
VKITAERYVIDFPPSIFQKRIQSALLKENIIKTKDYAD